MTLRNATFLVSVHSLSSPSRRQKRPLNGGALVGKAPHQLCSLSVTHNQSLVDPWQVEMRIELEGLRLAEQKLPPESLQSGTVRGGFLCMSATTPHCQKAGNTGQVAKENLPRLRADSPTIFFRSRIENACTWRGGLTDSCHLRGKASRTRLIQAPSSLSVANQAAFQMFWALTLAR